MVALGGGHGLAATLKALRRVTDQITAIVGVADDGGSSGRLRAEFGGLPPGDLRMALAALCGDDTWGRTWRQVIQHRFGGDGDLAGHSLGNLLITALWEETHDAVIGLDWVAALLEAQGRVLPCSVTPVAIVADVRGHDPAKPELVSVVLGQVAVATTTGDVMSIRLEPAEPEPCPDALAALGAADAIILGPGSWFTSVMPHLLIPAQLAAIRDSTAVKLLVLNLDPLNDAETSGASLDDHLGFMQRLVPDLRLDVVIADPANVEDEQALRQRCDDIGARLELASVGYPESARRGEHDPGRLAVSFGSVLGRWQDEPLWR
ncbi:unannotated protein [freshwater metagenome]|uniref:Unannotated protein n=1 Tax=freshwater metagenome TaxID=449393 RepID=A0A6J7KLQ1_9ZZZZ